jgi:hypothetical protein
MLVGLQTGATTTGTCMEVPQKSKIRTPSDPINHFWAYISRSINQYIRKKPAHPYLLQFSL